MTQNNINRLFTIGLILVLFALGFIWYRSVKKHQSRGSVNDPAVERDSAYSPYNWDTVPKMDTAGRVWLTDSLGKPSDSAIISIGDSWMSQPIIYKGKEVMVWDIDDRHYGRIESITDTAAALFGLMEHLKENSKYFGQVMDQRDTLQMELEAMHDTGKCPFGKKWHPSVHAFDFSTTAGCYSKKQWAAVMDTTNEPRLEISGISMVKANGMDTGVFKR